jgi:hypothetical protein
MVAAIRTSKDAIKPSRGFPRDGPAPGIAFTPFDPSSILLPIIDPMIAPIGPRSHHPIPAPNNDPNNPML